MSKSEANWQTIDVETLAPELRKAYEAFKVQQRAAAVLREEFETAMNKQAGLPATHRLAFGYRFGQLSAAVVEATPVKAKAKGAASLSDFLKAQTAAGART